MRIVLPAWSSRSAAALLLLGALALVAVGIQPIVAAYDGNLRAADELAQAVARNRVLERSLAELKGQVADLARAQPAQAGFLQAGARLTASASESTVNLVDMVGTPGPR